MKASLKAPASFSFLCDTALRMGLVGPLRFAGILLENLDEGFAIWRHTPSPGDLEAMLVDLDDAAGSLRLCEGKGGQALQIWSTLRSKFKAEPEAGMEAFFEWRREAALGTFWADQW
jgi:hypothetical protein